MASLDQVEFDKCNRITGADVSSLARLPRLRELAAETCQGVTLEGTRAVAPQVFVRYST